MNRIHVVSTTGIVPSEVPAAITFETELVPIAKSVGSECLLGFVLSWGKDIATGLVATFLYDSIKKHAAKHGENPPKEIRINGEIVDFHREQILRHIIDATNARPATDKK